MNYNELAFMFVEHDWRWNIGGELLVPTPEDIEKTITAATGKLKNEPVGSQLSVGRLIIKKEHTGFDVYIYMGAV